MCWLSKFAPVLKVAEADIPVKKVVRIIDGEISSPCYSKAKWVPKVIYEEVIGSIIYTPFKDYIINEGLHSCSDIEYRNGCFVNKSTKGSRVLFAAFPDMHIYNAIIPKGAKYYVNEHGKYVSNKLKLIDLCVG